MGDGVAVCVSIFDGGDSVAVVNKVVMVVVMIMD